MIKNAAERRLYVVGPKEGSLLPGFSLLFVGLSLFVQLIAKPSIKCRADAKVATGRVHAKEEVRLVINGAAGDSAKHSLLPPILDHLQAAAQQLNGGELTNVQLVVLDRELQSLANGFMFKHTAVGGLKLGIHLHVLCMLIGLPPLITKY